MTGSDPTLLAAVDQVALLAEGSLGACELLELVLDRHGRTKDQLNAVVVERIDQARRRAAELDRRLAAGERPGPLHGLPVTIKEAIDWVGTPSTWGDPAIVDNVAIRNAVVVDRLQAAGAVIWGKTNVPYRLGQWQTNNEIYGRTDNPWDRTRTPGGSSGGSAVSIAAGLAGLELGSDIGGSIRCPAHYCGIAGHKPTFGAVSTEGHRYPGQDEAADIDVVGPLARSARDLGLAMDLLAEVPLTSVEPIAIDRVRVGVVLDNPLGRQDDAMTAVLADAVDQLVERGAAVVDPPTPAHLLAGWESFQLLVRAARGMLDAEPCDAEHAARYDRGDRDHRAMAGKGATLSRLEWLELNDERERIRRCWADYFEGADVLLTPVAASAATPHDSDSIYPDQLIPVGGQLVSTVEQRFWTGIVGGSYLPATVVPVGSTPAGLPVGMQVVAPHGLDRRSIHVGRQLEELLGGYRPPPLVG